MIQKATNGPRIVVAWMTWITWSIDTMKCVAMMSELAAAQRLA